MNQGYAMIISIHMTRTDIKLIVQDYIRSKCHQMTKHAKTHVVGALWWTFFLVRFKLTNTVISKSNQLFNTHSHCFRRACGVLCNLWDLVCFDDITVVN